MTRRRKKYERMLKRARICMRLIEDQIMEMEEYYATHWRDDDCPKGEYSSSSSPESSPLLCSY